MKRTLIVCVSMLVVAVNAPTLGATSVQNVTSPNQIYFPPVRRSAAKPARATARTQSGATSGTKLQRPSLSRRSNQQGPTGKARLPRPRANSNLTVAKIGLFSATQIPAGGGLDQSGQYPTVRGDFNGDGKPDFANIVRVYSSSPGWTSSVSVVLGNGDGTFNPAILTPVQVSEFMVGDVNGDHKDDIIILHQVDWQHAMATFDVLISNGDGTFTPGNSYSITSNPLAGATLADVNADGVLDLVAADQASPGNVWTLLGNGDGTFQTPTFVSLGGTPAVFPPLYLTFADLNGDGMLDIALINGDGGELQVYLATSATSFAPPASYMTVDGHLNSGGLTAGDLTGDGKPELLVPNETDDDITVYKNNGDGTFQIGQYYAGALSATPGGTVADVCPYAVTVADVNSDGNADVISTNTCSSDITVLLGNGDSTLRIPSVGYAIGGYPTTSAIVADFDGDGRPDIVVGDNEFSLVYMRGYGDGTFGAALNYYSPIADGGHAYGVTIASGDFNGDGNEDFVVGNTGDPTVGITVFLSRTDGSLLPGVNYGTGDGNYESVAVADFDQNGKLDIAVADVTGGVVRIFNGVGDGTFTTGGKFTTDSSATWPVAIVAGDFNHDGYPDIAAVNYFSKNVGILLNDQNGGFVLSANYSLSGYPVYPSNIVAASLRGNSTLDLILPLAGRASVAVLSGNGDGTFLPEGDLALDGFPMDVAVGDLNQDAKPDLAVTVGSNGIDVVLGNGDGTFQTPQLFVSSLQDVRGDLPLTSNVKILDIDGDGKPDLVYTNPEFGTVGILYGRGDGTFDAPAEFPAGGYAWGLATADLNQDGAPDVVVAGDNFAGVTVLLNANGAGVQPGFTLSSSTSSAVVTAGNAANFDLTLASRNRFSGAVTFACARLPAGASCTFSPQSPRLEGNQQASVHLTISTAALAIIRSKSDVKPVPRLQSQIASLGSIGIFAFVLAKFKKHKRLVPGTARLIILCMVLSLVGCGSPKSPSIRNAGVTPGTYVVLVTATGTTENSGGHSASRTLYLNLTVR